MRADELLSIHAASERRRLTEASLEGPWQVPAELVRRAVASGARRIEVELHRDRVVVRDDGRPLAVDDVEDLTCLLDEARSPADRRQALLALEAAPALLAAVTLGPRRARVTPGLGGRGTSLVLEGTRLDADTARRSLVAAARFAPATIVVDGRVVPPGFDAAWTELVLDEPLKGRLAVTTEDTAHLWLLADGVISSHVTLPDAPAFEAAVELAPFAALRTPAALREAVEPHLPALMDRAVRAMLALAGREELGEEVHRRVVARLLVAARRGWRAAVLEAPLLPAVVGPEGRESIRLRLSDLGTAAPIPYVDPDDDVDTYRLPHGPVLRLDADDRGRLAQLLGIRFRPLEHRRAPAGFAARARRRLHGFGRRVSRTVGSLRGTFDRPLPDEVLTTEERRFLEAIRTALGPGGPRVTLTTGGGAPRSAPETLRLPRHHPDVAAAVKSVAREPARVYSAVLGLAEGHAPSAQATDTWQRWVDRQPPR